MIGYHSSIDQHDLLVCIENDSVIEKKRTSQWIMNGDMMEKLEDYKYKHKYKYFGTRNGYRYLFELIGKEIE